MEERTRRFRRTAIGLGESVALALLIAGFAAAAAAAAEDVVIARDGSAAIAIGVAGGSASDRHAADELATWLGRVTGASFAVVAPEAATHPLIAVGPEAARNVDPALDLDGLGDEGFVARTRAGDLVLTGGVGGARGTLNAVSVFLEDVGVRWWTDDAETVPHRPTLTVAAPDRRFVPTFEYRDVFWKRVLPAADWSTRNRVDGPFSGRDAARGGVVAYAGFVHTFHDLVPPEEQFAPHPEWYALVGGQRTRDGQLCLSDPALLAFVVERVRTLLREQPEARIVSVSQNDRPDADHSGRCACDACRAIELEEGAASGPLLRFVNAVAERIAPDHPGVAIDTLAYQYTRRPPRLTRPRDDVIVRLCSIECDFSRPLADDANAAFRDDLIAWSRICRRLYVWDYTTDYAHYLMPFPDLRVLGPNARLFADNGVRGVFEEGNQTSRGADFAELRTWVLAQLLWDPTRDATALIDEFLAGYYGAAAAPLRRYIDLVHDASAAAGETIGIYASPRLRFLDAPLVVRAEAALAEARSAVAGDAALARRVALAGVPMRYVALTRWTALRRQAAALGLAWPYPSRAALADEAVAICADHGVARLEEPGDAAFPDGADVPLLRHRFGAPRRDADPLPPALAALPPADVIDIPDAELSLWERDQGHADWRADAAAADGCAAWMPGDHRRWCVEAALDEPTAGDDAGPWTAYAVVRVDRDATAADDAPGLACGIWDRAAKAAVCERIVPAADLADGYRLVRIGACVRGAQRMAWAAPAAAPGVAAVWIDRVVLVRGERGEAP